MVNETRDLIDNIYEKENTKNNHQQNQVVRKSPKAKYQILTSQNLLVEEKFWEI